MTLTGHRADQRRQPRPVQAAYAAIVTSQVQIINILNVEINEMGRWWPTILAGSGTLTAI